MTRLWRRGKSFSLTKTKRSLEEYQIETLVPKDGSAGCLLLKLPLEIRQHIYTSFFRGSKATIHVHPLSMGSSMDYHECEYDSEQPYKSHCHDRRRCDNATLIEGQRRGKGLLHLLFTCRQM